MHKSKIIPYRILSPQNKEAQLLMTNRKQTKIKISKSPQQKSSPKLIKFEEGSSSQLTTSPKPFAASPRQFLTPVEKSDLSVVNESTAEAKTQADSENVLRLKNLHWVQKPDTHESNHYYSKRQSLNPDPVLSPSILPRIYSFQNFLKPFVSEAKQSDLQIQFLTPGNEKNVCWLIKEAWGDRPNGREGSQLVVVRGMVYLFGGQSRMKHTELRILDVNVWKWRIANPDYTPTGKLGHTLVPYKGKIVLYGGESQHSQNLGIRRCSRKVFFCSVKDKTWQHYTGDGERPEGRRHHGAAFIGRFMLIYGGVNQEGQTLSDLFLFNMKEKKWIMPDVIVQNNPGRRSHGSLTGVFDNSSIENYCEDFVKATAGKGKTEFINTGFYLFGGKNAEGKALNTLHGLYMRDGKLVWILIDRFSGTPPSPRYSHAASSVKNRLFVFGGRNDELFKQTGDFCLKDLNCFNVSSLSWENLKVEGSLPDGRWAHSMVSVRNRVLMFGGISTKSFSPADLYVLQSERVSIQQPSEARSLERSIGSGVYKKSEFGQLFKTRFKDVKAS